MGENMANSHIRVAHVVGKVVTGGVDAVVMNYYRHIDHEKVQFDFLMDGYNVTPIDNEITQMGGRVYKLEPYESNILKNMRQCYRIFKQGKYSIVHAHLNTLSVFPLFTAWLAGVPIRIVHNHSTAHKGEGKRTIMKELLRPFAKLFANRYAACSQHAGEWLFGKRCYAKGRVKLICNAIDVDKYRYDSDARTKIRREWGLDNKFVVGHCGRFVYQKNHSFLIDIFLEVKRQERDATLLLVGDGELLDDIKTKVERLGLADSVVFTGVRHDVNRFYQAMDVFVLPSFYEGLPVVGVEAQAAGLPCVFSDEMTAETKITSSSQFLTLKDTVDTWAERILHQKNFLRVNMKSTLGDAGFEIVAAAKELSVWYGKIVIEQE